jgi:hypothetical protein
MADRGSTTAGRALIKAMCQYVQGGERMEVLLHAAVLTKGAGRSIKPQLFEDIGRQLGIKPGQARKLYYRADKAERARAMALLREAAAAFLTEIKN